MFEKRDEDSIFRKKIMGDIVGFWRSQILYSASKLNVFSNLRAGNMSIQELSRTIMIDLGRLRRLLDALVVMGYLESEQSTYKLSRCGYILSSELEHAPLLWGEEQYEAFSGLWWSIKEGKSNFDKQFGDNFFAFLNKHPLKLRNYQLAMREYARIDYPLIPETVDFSKHKSIIDVGGGLGTLIQLILKKNPHVRGTLLDTAEVIDLISPLDENLPENLQFMKGDFFKIFLKDMMEYYYAECFMIGTMKK